AVTRARGFFSCLRALGSLGRLLRGSGLLTRLSLGGRFLARLRASLGLRRRLGLRLRQPLDALPDPAHAGLRTLELHYCFYSRHPVSDLDQALGGPLAREAKQFLLRCENLARDVGCGRFLGSSEGRDVVIDVNRERRHFRNLLLPRVPAASRFITLVAPT